MLDCRVALDVEPRLACIQHSQPIPCVLQPAGRLLDSRRTFSSKSSIFFSVSVSSSVGLGEILGAVEYCEYVWNKLSVCLECQLFDVVSTTGQLPTCVSNVRACCLSWAQPAFAVGAAMAAVVMPRDDES